jgi:hypothetical protein
MESFGNHSFYNLSLLVNKGQRKKRALIAVANKIRKHSFAIVKSGRSYDERYVSVLPR